MTYWDKAPPLRDHLNICLAQTAQTVANSQLVKGQKAMKLDKFIIDYGKSLPSKKDLNTKLNTILGGFVKKG